MLYSNKKVIAILFGVILLLASSAQAESECSGTISYENNACCSTLGETHLDTNSTAVLACLWQDATKSSKIWKFMTESTAQTAVKFSPRDFKLVTSIGTGNNQAVTPVCPAGMTLINRIGVSSYAYYTDVGLCIKTSLLDTSITKWPLNYCGHAVPGGNVGVECP